MVILSRVFLMSLIFSQFVEVDFSLLDNLASSSLILELITLSDISVSELSSSLVDSRVLSLLSMLIIFSSDSLIVLMAVLVVDWASLTVLRASMAFYWASSAFCGLL